LTEWIKAVLTVG